MIFFLYIITLNAQNTVVFDFDAQQNLYHSSWVWPTSFSASFTTCNSQQIYGGFNQLSTSFSSYLRNFQANLAPHYKLQVEIQLSRFGDWNGDKFEVRVDNTLIYQQSYLNSAVVTQCNSMQYEEDLIVFVIDHNFRSAYFLLRPLSTTSDTIYYGIKKFKVSIQECSPQCDYCRFENDDCQWSLAYSSITQMYLNNPDGWTNPTTTTAVLFEVDSCCQWIYQPSTKFWKSFQLAEHEYIKIRARHDYEFILVVDNVVVPCQQPQKYQVCETEQISHKTSKVNVTIIPLNEFHLRDFELFIGKDQPTEPQSQCLQYVNSNCIQCLEGWDFISNNIKCLPICGDGVIRGNEECDYGVNAKFYPNCINCKYQCDKNCINCLFGICQQCNQDYYLNGKKICTQEFQEFSLQVKSEQFDYLNDNLNQRCSELILKCDDGWSVEPIQKQCQPICGDGLIRGEEECDNGSNLHTFHNCVKCKYQCDPFCTNCKFGVCQQCYEGYYLNEKNTCTGQCQNKSLQQIINQNYIFQITDQMCFKQIFQCEKGWHFEPLQQECQTICGDGLIRGHEECDYGSNSKQIVGCVNCIYQCDPNCVNCRRGMCSGCKEGYYLNGKNICEQKCQENSLTTVINEQYDYTNNKDINHRCFSSFQKCEEGYNFDPIQQQCQTICGDGLIRGFEQCDYGNNQHFSDNCVNCQYYCDQYCKKCVFGVCQECNEGYYLNQNNICKKQELCKELDRTTYIQDFDEFINENQDKSCKQQILKCEDGWDFEPILQQCEPICGDGLIRGDEQCDYGNDINSLEICVDCQFVCDNFENCIFCNDVVCITCERGFELIFGKCQPVCGDQIVIEKFEQCDDGNNIEYDGCYNCQFQCIKDCNICQDGQCLLKCEEGYEFKQNQCINVCGDMIKTIEEECDDGNVEPFDGCFECKFSCPLNCKTCLLDICIECDQFFEIEDNQCNVIINCGNGQIDFNETCDDQNENPNDGCYQCQIEDDWVCIQYDLQQLSECAYQKGVDVSLNYLNMTENIQIVELKFSDIITVIGFQTLQETLHYTLLDIPQDKYVINLIEIIQDEHYIFQIQINELLSEAPYFFIKISDQVISQFDRPIDQNEHVLRLRFPKYLTKNQKEQAEMLLNLNKIVLYSLAGFVGISLLFGILDPFLEIISILQYQQNFRYLNLSFPLNLEIYFSINDMLDITPLMEFLNIDFLMNLFQVPISYKQSIGKFLEYEVNSDLISNLQAQFIQTLLTLIIALILKSNCTNIYRKLFNSKFFYFASSLALEITPNIVFYLCSGIHQIVKMILALRNMVSEDGINQLIYVNAWDVIFKVFLYLSSIKYEQTFTSRDQIQIFISIVTLGFYFKLLFQTLFSPKKVTQKQPKKEQKFQDEQRFFGFNIMRQLIFLFVLVQFQDQPILQSLTSSLLSIFYTILLIYFRRIQIPVNFYTNVIVEISVTLFTLSAASYGQDFSNFFDEKFKIFTGWMQIIILSLGLQFYLIYSVLKVVITYIQNKFEVEKVQASQKKIHMFL